jgi:hypothetical protein
MWNEPEGGSTALQSPLGKLLQYSLYGNRIESSRSAAEAEESALVLCTCSSCRASALNEALRRFYVVNT